MIAMLNPRKFGARLQRSWAGMAKRDEMYNRNRARQVRSPFLKQVYLKEAALDHKFAKWRLGQARKYLR